MAPTCLRAALRLLVTVLVASSIANAAALPHQVLDPRVPLAQTEDVPLSDEAIQAANGSGDDEPNNFFESIAELLRNNSGWDIFRDFWARLFGDRDDENEGDGEGDDDDSTITTTVYVTPTPSSDVVLPPGPPMTTSTDIPTSSTSDVASITSIPASGIISILPVGNPSTAINATTLLFSTSPVTETPAPSLTVSILPPYPTNVTSTTIFPTAVSITGWFSVNPPLSTGASAPAGTGLQPPWYGNSSTPTINPSLILTDPIRPTSVSNYTGLNTTSTTVNLTSVVLVTETVTPSPILVTSTAPVGTGGPIAISETPLYPNSTYAVPTVLPGTGTSALVSAGTISPTAASESPLYPNITAPSATIAPTLIIPVPVTVTGVPDTVFNVSITIPPAPYPNTTYVLPGTGSASASASVGTELPVTISESPIYPNTTVVTPTALSGTRSTAPSAGTISPVVSFSEPPTYPNTTTATSTSLVVETATATLILPSIPTPSDDAVEFPGQLNVTLPSGGY